MIAFVLRRIFASLGVLIAVGLIAFAMFRYVGDPVNQMVGVETSVAERAQLRDELGLNDPAIVQALRFLGAAARFDFGVSYQFKEPVFDLFRARMPATMELAFVASILSLLAGVPMGVYAALNRHGALSRLLQAVSLIGISLPTFLTGILLIALFSVKLGWLPSFGRGEVVRVGPWWTTGFLTVSGLKSLIMPAITLALFQMTLIMRLVRAEMLEVLRADYIRFARARGLSESAIHFRHALKNTLVPVITVVGLQLGSIIAFSIITETVFAWPGLGQLFLQSIQNVDVPIMAAYLLFIAFMFVIINLVADVLYASVDPRLRASIGARGSR
jgi:peptide/nickel transport system permease protein